MKPDHHPDCLCSLCTRDARPYFLHNRPDEPHATLADARVAAGMIQCEQAQRGHKPLSIQILQNGEVVDLKRV